MAKCPACGKNVGLFEPNIKIKELNGKISTFHEECGKKEIERTKADYQRTIECTFQMPSSTSGKFRKYDCWLTQSAYSSASGEYVTLSDTQINVKECNLEKCPMYQTWQLLKKEK